MAKKILAVGSVVTTVALRNAYDQHAEDVLQDYLNIVIPRPKRGPRRYQIRKTLPAKDEYAQLLSRKYTTSVEALVDDAYSQVEDLGDEVRQVYDGMPESLQGGDRGTRLDDAATSCEDVASNKPEAPKLVKTLDVYFPPSNNADSRKGRAEDAADMLSTAATAVREFLGNPAESGHAEPLTKDEVSFLEEFADQLESDESTLRDIDFPGMYG